MKKVYLGFAIDVLSLCSPMTLAQLYDEFVAAGGKVMACSACAEAAGITASNLRSGAQMAQENQDVPNLILAADKAVDF